jgi:hypothetical protein
MDDVIVNKAAIIERCLQRIKEEYIGFEKELDVFLEFNRCLLQKI